MCTQKNLVSLKVHACWLVIGLMTVFFKSLISRLNLSVIIYNWWMIFGLYKFSPLYYWERNQIKGYFKNKKIWFYLPICDKFCHLMLQFLYSAKILGIVCIMAKFKIWILVWVAFGSHLSVDPQFLLSPNKCVTNNCLTPPKLNPQYILNAQTFCWKIFPNKLFSTLISVSQKMIKFPPF